MSAPEGRTDMLCGRANRLFEGAKKLQITLPIEPARGRDGAVVGVVAGHLNFRNGKGGGALSVGTSFDRPSRARAASDSPRRCARLDPAQEKCLQFAFALHANAAARRQRERTRVGAGAI